MAANSYSSSTSGDTRVPVKAGPQSGRNRIDLDQEASEILDQRKRENELLELYLQLPANKGAEANINFLGSSFSGVDVKVVAHLYDSDEGRGKESRLTKLQLRVDIANAVIDGCTNIITNGQALADGNANTVLTYAERREIFLQTVSLTGDDEASQEAAKIMLNGIFKNGNFTFLGVASMQRRATDLRQTFRKDAASYQEQIRQLKELDQESSTTVVLGTLQTISVQSFREKNAVRALGHSYAKGYTRGARTIGGSMIFTIFNEHALSQLIRSMGDSYTYGERDSELTSLLPDQLPPVDLTIVFANEYGSLSDFRLYGVEWFTDGSVFSIDDLLSEQTMSFVCRDADVMTSRGKVRLSRLQRGMFNGKDDKDLIGSELAFNNADYVKFLDKLGVRRRLTNR